MRGQDGRKLNPAFGGNPAIPAAKPQGAIPTLKMPTARGWAKGETPKAWLARLTEEQRAELIKWVSDHRWHPHQLRHNAATRLRREYGLEAAQVILGHKTLSVTEVYAEKNVAAARKIMGEVG